MLILLQPILLLLLAGSVLARCEPRRFKLTPRSIAHLKIGALVQQVDRLVLWVELWMELLVLLIKLAELVLFAPGALRLAAKRLTLHHCLLY